MTHAEEEERKRLDLCLERITQNIQSIAIRLRVYADDVQANKAHMWDARRDMDHLEKVAIRQSIEQRVRSAEILREQQNKLVKLKRSPYFGRFDFSREAANALDEVYVGVHDFRDDEVGRTLVYDWRAPISSMFYDYEIGPARYDAPSGRISGELQRKRQFRIRDGRMEFMIESGVNIIDDVLQKELSRSSDENMKNIVATIQRDQNAIIRDADAHTLIIQGVAGSGKTSIALHRIAFLLYLAIIAKTQKQATRAHQQLSKAGAEARLLDATSVRFSSGVVVCTAHIAKGLEFDRVIVFDASDMNYRTEMDRNLLYVACTRAMHRLSVFALREPSGFLPK